MRARSRVLPALVAFAALIVASSVTAQPCFVPDNLNGPCCGPVGSNVPQLPGAQIPGLGVCWTNCAPSQKNDLRVVWQTPPQAPCGQYSTPIDVFTTVPPMHIMTGKMVLDYSRTWTEVDVTGAQYQVWRFVAKADMSAVPIPVPGPVCPTPPSLAPFGPHPSAFFDGYVDYARRCGQAGFDNTIVLFHANDHFINTPFSAFPVPAGGLNPTSSFAIIGFPPGQSFTPMNLPAPGGPVVSGGMRRSPPPGQVACVARDPLSGGALIPFASACLCTPFSLLPPQVTLRVFNGVGSCIDATGLANQFASQNIAFPLLPWIHLVTHSMGHFVSPQIYPGQEVAHVDEGLFRVRDVCSPNDFFEIYYGGSTSKGWNVLSTAANPLTQNFTDIAANYGTAGAVILPLFGVIMPTRRVIHANVP